MMRKEVRLNLYSFKSIQTILLTKMLWLITTRLASRLKKPRNSRERVKNNKKTSNKHLMLGKKWSRGENRMTDECYY